MLSDESKLFYGDNLGILRDYIPSESVDLIYLDPPFKSNQDYNVLFAEQDGSRSAAQIRAFEDTWHWDQAAATAYHEVVESGGKVSEAIQAFRKLLGESDMLAYLAMIAPRLVELRRVLKSTGSIYLHCDSSASAHLRLLMDAVFGHRNFRNEIIWYYYNKMHDRRKRLFPKANDTILFYVKDLDSNFSFHQLKEMREKPVKQLARKKLNGRMVNVKDEEGHVVYRLKDDRTIDNIWRIPCLQPAAQERLGYPTQKPEAILARIIQASSNEADLVLDPFCGCGTTIAAAQRLNRRWIGIDVTHLAVGLIKHRLWDSFGLLEDKDYRVLCEPEDIKSASKLAEKDPYQFQSWALGKVGARQGGEVKKGADHGIDGRLYFHDERGGKTRQIIFSVKSGNLKMDDVRALRGVIEREKAEIGVLISMKPFSATMRAGAAKGGFYQSPWGTTHPHLQLLTIDEILNGKKVDYPPSRANVTFKKAPKVSNSVTNVGLPFD